MKILTLCLLALTSVPAYAETITCTFTEPFLTVVVNERTRMVTEQNMGRTTRRLRASKMVRRGRTTSVSYGRPAGTLTTLTYRRDGRGSDGMSDAVYPYTGMRVLRGERLVGGCESSRERRRMDEGLAE